ncbi:MAG: lytic transglycosylase domain-containing protein [Bacteroidaceae bacterium]|nr:lytic transglycosylase domain-containing protein [Bacteroidaceae bacterium]
MMRKKLILTVLLMLPISISAQKEQFDWTPVMDAIIQVESKGNPKAHNPSGDCAGILQITPGLVKQCNIWLKAKKSKKRYTLADRYNVEKSKEMFVMVQSYYNKSNNVEKAIRIWNGGPGYTIKGTNGYLKKVMKDYKEKGAD